MAADANRFFAAHHLPGLAAGQFTVDTGPGFAASCDGQADVPEEPLDVETAHIIAPVAKIVYVAADCTADTLADNGQQGLLDADTRVVDQHLGDVATESYSVAETQFSPATAAAWTHVFEQGAAEGIGFDFDSGDGGDLAGQGAGGGSNGASGEFFEGAVTSGYPSDATENAVQAELTTAGYAQSSALSGPIVSGLSSSECVDDSAFSTTDGNKIQMWDCTGGVNQQWTAEPDGTLQVYGKCMDITGANYSNSTNIELWTCNGGANQQWHLP